MHTNQRQLWQSLEKGISLQQSRYLFRRKSWPDNEIQIKMHGKRSQPVSRLPMIVSSPNRALFHMELECITPSVSSSKKSHVLVVCSFLPSLGKIETTFGWSAFHDIFLVISNYIYPENNIKIWRKFLLAIWAASSSSSVAAKPLMCLV